MSKSESTDRHANARDRKRANSRKMVVTNRSIFTLREAANRRAVEQPHSFVGAKKKCGRCQQGRRAPVHDKAA